MTTFDEEFDQLWAIAYRVAYRILGRREEAEDVAQDALGRVLLRWNQVADHAAPFTARVAGQRAIDVWRKQAPIRTSSRALAASGPPVGPAAPDRPVSDGAFIERDRLVTALRTLPARQRQAILLPTSATSTSATRPGHGLPPRLGETAHEPGAAHRPRRSEGADMMLDHLDHLDDPVPPAPQGRHRTEVRRRADRLRRRRRRWIASGIGAVALVAAGAAMLVWPDQPASVVVTAPSTSSTASTTSTSAPPPTSAVPDSSVPTPSTTLSTAPPISHPATPTTQVTTPSVQIILAPARVPPVGPLCSQPLTLGADGTAAPLLCANGDVNQLAWAHYAGVAVDLMTLGRGATQGAVIQAACADLNDHAGNDSTFPIESDAYTLAATYYGWSPRFDLGNLLVTGGVCDSPPTN